jgi:hypothetical protein
MGAADRRDPDIRPGETTMTRITSPRWLAVSTLALALAWPALGQGGPRAMRRGMPSYDPATETTLCGTVTDVLTRDDCCRGGIHLRLQAEAATYEVHVGPSFYLEEISAAFAAGDEIEVTGARARFGGREDLIARTIRRGETTFELRDGEGRPRWAGSGMGRGGRCRR